MWGSSREPHKTGTLSRLLAVAAPPFGWIAGAIAAQIVVALLGALPPLLTGRIVDALQTHDAGKALRDLFWLSGATVAAGAATFFSTYASAVLRESIARSLRVGLMRKLLRARIDRLERLTLGQVANRVNADIADLCARVEYSAFPALQGLFAVAAMAVTMLWLDARFALISLIAVALAVAPAKLVVRHYAELQESDARIHDELADRLSESTSLSAMALLRNVRAAGRELANYGVLVDRARATRLKSAMLNALSGLATTLLSLAGPIAVLSTGAYLLLHHSVSVGTIVTFLMYQARLYAPFAGLTLIPLQIAGIRVTTDRVLEIADLEEERSGNLPFVAGDLCVGGVCVDRGQRRIVNGAALRIPRGARAAIVGASGSGKSTLAVLLLRLHDPSAGFVTIGGRDIRDIALPKLRDAVAVVAQDPLLFDTTLRENLTFINPSATSAELDRALRVCRLERVVERLPLGLETPAGQRGFRFSGGERQRICIARALLAKPEVLVLDEALTGVDLETEARIVADIANELSDRTLVVITHRLPSIKSFDPIVVVEEGCVSAQGSHADVLAASPWYRSAFREAVCA